MHGKIIEHNQTKYHLTFGTHFPVMRLASGSTVRCSVPDCDGYDANGQRLPDERFERGDNNAVPIGNPCAGPWYLEDAQPGQAIRVRIKSIEVDSCFGRTGLNARQIHFPGNLLAGDNDTDGNVQVPREIRRWTIHPDKTAASMEMKASGGKVFTTKLSPFPGCIAVAPPKGEFIYTVNKGPFGGNIDISLLTAGCSVDLPVFVPGALLFIGDIHAGQGDGEIIGGGIEVSGTITFSVERLEHKRICYPQWENDQYIGAIGVHPDLKEAFNIAYSQMILRLCDEYGYNRWDAFHALSQVCLARPGGYQSATCYAEKKLFEK